MNKQNEVSGLNRRDFLGNSFASMMLLMGGVAITRGQQADATAEEKPSGPPINLGLIGCGQWGRDILDTLGRFPRANVVALCDTYAPYLRRAGRSAPNAQKYEDYRQLLDNADVHAVIVATPTHLHKQIVLDALQAGKHVYCEAPLAHTVEDAREIAKAARAAKRLNFQSGLQQRSDPEIIHILNFVRAGAIGTAVMARAQWHRKTSWRRQSPNADFQRALNWRLQAETSLGLVGEEGINQVDAAAWFMNRRPNAVTGFGNTILWNDGREVPDTVQAVFEHHGPNLVFDATLANSFDAAYEQYYGSAATVMLRDRRGWMFKEVDSPLLGWEVYARKETFFKEVGIVLAANATKLAAQGDNPVIDTQIATQNSLFYALEAFIYNTGLVKTGVEDFTSAFGEGDDEMIADYLKDIVASRLPAAGYQEGYEATISVIKGHEAVMKKSRIEIPSELLSVG